MSTEQNAASSKEDKHHRANLISKADGSNARCTNFNEYDRYFKHQMKKHFPEDNFYRDIIAGKKHKWETRDELRMIIEGTPISDRKVSDLLGYAKMNEKCNALEHTAWTAVVESLEKPALDFIKGRKPKEYDDAESISDYATL